MIKIESLNKEEPYLKYQELYDLALSKNQNQIERILIASFNTDLKEVNARYVNLKYVIKDEWIFFSNYESVKAKDFLTHNQITAVSYWSSIDVQIRMKATINKSIKEFSDKHYSLRSKEKNALAISSLQSQPVNSYEDVKNNYKHTLSSRDLNNRPTYWGGYSFIPYYFEFWKGHESRINKREIYKNEDNEWIKSFLSP
jgi:pyridoxamine 5'-phosphate oxidase